MYVFSYAFLLLFLQSSLSKPKYMLLLGWSVCSFYPWYLRLDSLPWENTDTMQSRTDASVFQSTFVTLMWSSTSPPLCLWFLQSIQEMASLSRIYIHTLGLAACVCCLFLFSTASMIYHRTVYAKQLIRKQSSVLIECSLKAKYVWGLVWVLLPLVAQLQVTLSGWRQSRGVSFSPQGFCGLMLFYYNLGWLQFP